MDQQLKLLMQQEGKSLGTLSPGGPADTRFRSFIGAGVTTIIVAWHAMAKHDLLPNHLLFVHYLCALVLCVSTQRTRRFFVLFSGDLTPRPFKKTRPFVFAVYELNYFMVSFNLLI